MLSLMPRLRAEPKFVELRQVPNHHRGRQREPGNDWMYDHPAKLSEAPASKKWAERVLEYQSWQTTQQRQYGLSQQKEWRRHHDEQQVLDHVRLQQQAAEGIHRRIESQ